MDLRYRTKDVLRAIDRGESVTLLYRGKPKAELTPIQASRPGAKTPRPKLKDQPFFGMWKDRKDMADPSAYVRAMRKNRV